MPGGTRKPTPPTPAQARATVAQEGCGRSGEGGRCPRTRARSSLKPRQRRPSAPRPLPHLTCRARPYPEGLRIPSVALRDEMPLVWDGRWAILEGGGWPKLLAKGKTKQLRVERHARRVFAHGLSRDFSLWFYWLSRSGRVLRRKQVGISVVRNKTSRWDFRLWCPLAHRNCTLHFVAARLKENRLEPGAMRDREGDHRRGYRGWHILLWARVRSAPGRGGDR